MVETGSRQDMIHYKKLIRKAIAEKQKHHYRRMNTVEWLKIDGFYQKLIENYRGKIELARRDVM
jgi:flavin-dependent dehydrogenase